MSTPIVYRDTPCFSFKQIDDELQAPKGTAFKLFKRGLETLIEGVDYFCLDADSDACFIEPLRERGAIYRSTRHLVLLTERGRQRIGV